MSYENPHTHHDLASRVRDVLREHQRDGLSMIGNADRLVGSLVRAVEGWVDSQKGNAPKEAEKRSA